MIEIFSRGEMESKIREDQLVLFFISRPECGVCTVLKKKVLEFTSTIKGLKTYYINLNNDESIAGQFSIFTIPAILLYVNEKEYVREARYISMDLLENSINRILDQFSS